MHVTQSSADDGKLTSGDLTTFSSSDSHIEINHIFGSNCLSFFNPLGAPWIYIKTPAPLVLAGSKVQVTVEVFIEFEAEIWIEYDSLDASVDIVNNMLGAFKRTKALKISVSEGWCEKSFYIDDPRFEGRVNGADFRVVVSAQLGKHAQIRQIRLDSDILNSSKQNLKEHSTTTNINQTSIVIETSDTPLVSIIMPVFNNVSYTLQCIRHILLHKPNALFELIIIDNGSDVHDSNKLDLISGAKVVRLGFNSGFAVACNHGVSISKGDLLLFLNNDTIPKDGWLDNLVNSYHSNYETRIVGSKLLYPESGLIQHAGVYLDSECRPYHCHEFAKEQDVRVNLEREVPAVTGASMLTDRQLFREIGGFDEKYRNGYEDIDFCMRARQSDVKILYCPSSSLYHYQSVTEGRFDNEDSNRNLFLKTWRDFISVSEKLKCL